MHSDCVLCDSFPWLCRQGPQGESVEIPWSFVEDGLSHPSFPEVQCPAIIIHGIFDNIVPVQHSLKYKAILPDLVNVVELEDDHGLGKKGSLDAIERVVVEFFGLEQ